MEKEFLIEVKYHLYEDDYFAIVMGYDGVNERDNRIGLRWTGKKVGSPFPKGSGAQPRWFFLPEQFTESFLRSLLYKKGAKNDEIIKALGAL